MNLFCVKNQYWQIEVVWKTATGTSRNKRLCRGLSQGFAVGSSIDGVGGRICHHSQYNGSAVFVILIPSYTFLVFFSCISDKFGWTMIPILAFLCLAKAWTMAPLNSPATPLNDTKDLSLDIYHTWIRVYQVSAALDIIRYHDRRPSDWPVLNSRCGKSWYNSQPS